MLDLYAPFQVETRKLALLASLRHIWRYHQWTPTSGVSKLLGPAGTSPVELYAWELDILSREILLHASTHGEDSLGTFQGLVRFINHIRRINEGISRREIHSGEAAMRALHAQVHQQIRWQHTRDEARLFRTFRMFGYPDLERVFVEATGVPVRALFTLGLAIRGALNRDMRFNSAQDFTAFEVTNEVRDAFFRMVSADDRTVREQLRQFQKYDNRWAYTWNPLERTPLISITGVDRSVLWCPIPTMLFRRITEGLFYDIVKQPLYSNPYGKAFETYVGDVLHEIFKCKPFTVTAEEPYESKYGNRHGADWIVGAATANIFIECKTKRMSNDAKISGEGETLDSELDDLAKAVAQHYANIDDAVAGRSNWKPNNSPVYPFVVTYEDWYLFTPQVIESLDNRIQVQLQKRGLPLTFLESMPYFITSIAEFEVAAQAIAHIGIDRYCAKASTKGYRRFRLSSFAQEDFPAEHVNYRRLFGDSWTEIFPSFAHMLDLPPATQ
jgi:hypothetical protein